MIIRAIIVVCWGPLPCEVLSHWRIHVLSTKTWWKQLTVICLHVLRFLLNTGLLRWMAETLQPCWCVVHSWGQLLSSFRTLIGCRMFPEQLLTFSKIIFMWQPYQTVCGLQTINDYSECCCKYVFFVFFLLFFFDFIWCSWEKTVYMETPYMETPKLYSVT